MFHIHKWPKWKIIDGTSTYINRRTNTKTTVPAQYQTRKCEKCGKTQLEDL